MPTRLTNIFQVTTAPSNLQLARQHTGGWSESFWTNLTPSAYNPIWAFAQQKRALLLPASAAIVGYRTQEYTISGNKLLPGGATSGRQNLPGSSSRVADLPQVSLMLNCTTSSSPNTSRMILRGIPDDVMEGGEYQPNAQFQSAVTQYINSMIGFNFGFVGRDLTQASVRVLKIAANLITVDQIPGTGLNIGDFIRLHRVYDDVNNPVKGAFPVTAIAGNVLTVQGLDATLTAPSGTLRRDLLMLFNYRAMQPIRAVVKKVGRPFEQYRGRRSKTRV